MSRSKKQSYPERHSSEGEEDDEEEEYEVEKILKVRLNPKTKKKEYFVKWENWPLESSTWEPESNLKNVRDLVDEFEAQQRIRGHSIPDSSSTKKPPPFSNHPSNNTAKKSQNSYPIPTGDSRKSSNQFNERESKNSCSDDDDHGLFGPKKDFNERGSRPGGQKQSIQGERPSVFEQQPRTQKRSEQSNFMEEEAVPSNSQKTGQNQPQDQQPQEYVFDKIVDKRFFNGQAEYLVSFQGMSASQWVQEIDLEDFAAEIEEYNESANKKALSTAPIEEEMEFEKKPTASKGNLENNNLLEDEYKNKTSTPTKEVRDQHQLDTIKQPQRKRLLINDDDDDGGDNHSHLDPKRSEMSSAKSKKIKESRVNSDQRIEEEVDQSQLDAQKESGRLKKGGDSSSKKKGQSSGDMKKRQKRTISEFNCSNEFEGEFKTDNVESMTILGDQSDILSCQVQVAWKPRDGGKKALPTLYSISFVRRHEPDLLIEHLMNVISAFPHSK